MKRLPMSLLQFLDDRFAIEFNGGERLDNRTTTAMWTWLFVRKSIREHEVLLAEYAKRMWRAKR